MRTVAGATTVGLAGCGGGGGSNEPDWILQAPRPSSTSLVTQILEGIRGEVRDDASDLRLELVGADYTDGGMQSLGENEIDITIAPEVYGRAAYYGENITEDINYADYTGRKPAQLFGLFPTRIWWVTYSDDISTFDDLQDVTVGMPLSGITGTPETGPILKGMLKAAGVLSQVQVKDINYGDLPTALDDGEVDVVPNLMRGPSAIDFMQYLDAESMNVVRLTDSHVQSFNQSPIGRMREVDLNAVPAYARQFEEPQIQATSFDAVLYCALGVGTEPAKAMTRVSLSSARILSLETAAMGDFGGEEAASLLSTNTPVHPGAAAYLEENDLWRDDLSTPEDSG